MRSQEKSSLSQFFREWGALEGEWHCRVYHTREEAAENWQGGGSCLLSTCGETALNQPWLVLQSRIEVWAHTYRNWGGGKQFYKGILDFWYTTVPNYELEHYICYLFPHSSYCASITEIWTIRETCGEGQRVHRGATKGWRVFFFFFRRSIGVKLERINLRKGVYNNLTTVLNHMKEIQMSVLFYFVLISTEDRIKRYELKSQLEGI